MRILPERAVRAVGDEGDDVGLDALIGSYRDGLELSGIGMASLRHGETS